MKTTLSLKKIKLILFIMVLTLCLCACGEKTCDFCGEKKICREFDIAGVKRNICSDCLNNTASAVSSNVARKYAELYEKGELEYPEGSPLRPVDKNSNAQAATPSVGSSDTTGLTSFDIDTSLGQTDLTDDHDTHEPGADTSSSGNSSESDPSDSDTGSSSSSSSASSGSSSSGSSGAASGSGASSDSGSGSSSSASGSGSDSSSGSGSSGSDPGSSSSSDDSLVASLNRTLQADSLVLKEDKGKSRTYKLYSGDKDTGVVFTTASNNGKKDKLTIDTYSADNSQEFVKSVIRSILAYVDSSDYDGLGHDIYNNAVQYGNYSSNGIKFYYSEGSADDIEKGYPRQTFEIIP